jgi:hypothetical protein
MNFDAAEKIANAVLYEGYMLYPYRPSAIKNQQRWNFGTLYPAQYEEVRIGAERSAMHCEFLLHGNLDRKIGVCVRFLQLEVERVLELTLDDIVSGSTTRLEFPGKASDIKGSIHLDVENLAPELLKVRLDLNNESEIESTATREEVLALALSSAHLILGVDSGEFVSLLDPPGEFQQFAVQCENIGCFPVLVGDAGQRNMLLCSPIILYDYAQIAPESAGDFFDSTEMDEMLTLRVMTMTDEEKQEVRSAHERTRALLDRTERTAREQLMRTHGIIRDMRPVNPNE